MYKKKFLTNEFDLQDFYKQLKNVKKLGPAKNLLKMIPGLSNLNLDNLEPDEKIYARIESIILSMTPQERKNPQIINGSRKKRIANGSGRTINDVNVLLKRFSDTKKMIKMFTSNKKSLFNFFK